MTLTVAVTCPIERRYCSAAGDGRPSGGQTLTALLPPTEDSRREPTIPDGACEMASGDGPPDGDVAPLQAPARNTPLPRKSLWLHLFAPESKDENHHSPFVVLFHVCRASPGSR
jgi:hypothetical protein